MAGWLLQGHAQQSSIRRNTTHIQHCKSISFHLSLCYTFHFLALHGYLETTRCTDVPGRESISLAAFQGSKKNRLLETVVISSKVFYFLVPFTILCTAWLTFLSSSKVKFQPHPPPPSPRHSNYCSKMQVTMLSFPYPPHLGQLKNNMTKLLHIGLSLFTGGFRGSSRRLRYHISHKNLEYEQCSSPSK